MENSKQSSFLKSLALAFGDGLAFGVAVKLAQGPAKSREEDMADLGPLSERLSKVEDRIEQSQSLDKEALAVQGESLGRVLEKVVRALEARLTEHAGQVNRQLAEMDAKTALDLHALENHATSQGGAFERALQQVEGEVRGYVEVAQQHSAEQIAGVDHKLSALQEALPAKFREIVDAVRQSLEARLALELKELEERYQARAIAPEQLHDLEAKMRAEVDALAGKLAADVQQLAEQQQSQAAPLQQGLQQLEGKLDTLREELPPKIRQIVEAVEGAMQARMAAGDTRTGEQLAALEAKLAGLRQELAADSRTPALEQHLARLQDALGALDERLQAGDGRLAAEVAALQRALEDDLRRHAEQVSTVEQKLTVLQAELPPKFKAIVDAVRESMEARMAAELSNIEEQARLRSEQAADGLRQAVEAKLAGDIQAIEVRAQARAGGLEAELNSLAAKIQQLEASLRSEREAEASTWARSADVEHALQYASLLEARMQSLEQQLHANFEATVERAVERVWQSLESRLQQRAAQAPPAALHPLESITALRQKSTSAEQSVLDLIAGLGDLFEKPAPQAAIPTEPKAEPQAAAPAPAPEPVVAAEPLPPEPPAVKEEPAIAALTEVKPEDPKQPEEAPEEVDEKPPVILFKPKEAGRKWRIPFVSSFFLMGLALVWLQFM